MIVPNGTKMSHVPSACYESNGASSLTCDTLSSPATLRASAALKRLASAVRFRPWPPFSITYRPAFLSLVAIGCTSTTLLHCDSLF